MSIPPTLETGIAATIAITVVGALIWLVKEYATGARDREKRREERDIAREQTHAGQTAEFTEVARQFAVTTQSNTTVLTALTGAIDDLRDSHRVLHQGHAELRDAVENMAERVDAFSPYARHIEEDVTPVARPRLVGGGYRSPKPGKKDEP